MISIHESIISTSESVISFSTEGIYKLSYPSVSGSGYEYGYFELSNMPEFDIYSPFARCRSVGYGRDKKRRRTTM